MELPVPVLLRAAGTCFTHCSSWMILCGGVGLAASIIAHVVRRDSKPKERRPKENNSPCIQIAAQEPKEEKIDKKVSRVSKRKKPASKQVGFMHALKAPKGNVDIYNPVLMSP
ncbi:hypothetical protein NQZ79_g988 [Umbelopsis isabellina]|nr:hypothetical protein NQZ79_g988 [Umbelopsis isabellina]